MLEKHGVKKFEPLGEKFDPNLHQAMFEMPDPSRPVGTVAQVVQPGYMIGERVLRPALVAVAKGGPKLTPPASTTVQPFVSFLPNGLSGKNATVDQLVERLASNLRRPVLNHTGFRGN